MVYTTLLLQKIQKIVLTFYSVIFFKLLKQIKYYVFEMYKKYYKICKYAYFYITIIYQWMDIFFSSDIIEL